jgi:hypothetical protein
MDLMKCRACVSRVSNFYKECIRHSKIEKAGEISLLHVGGMVFEIFHVSNSCGSVLVMALPAVPTDIIIKK